MTGVAPEKRRGKDGKLYPVKAKKKEESVATESEEAMQIVTESKKSIVEASTLDVIEADVPETESVEESPSDDQRRIDANVKRTQIHATISQLETQLLEWFEIAPDDMHEDFDQDVGNRIRSLCH